MARFSPNSSAHSMSDSSASSIIRTRADSMVVQEQKASQERGLDHLTGRSHEPQHSLKEVLEVFLWPGPDCQKENEYHSSRAMPSSPRHRPSNPSLGQNKRCFLSDGPCDACGRRLPPRPSPHARFWSGASVSIDRVFYRRDS